MATTRKSSSSKRAQPVPRTVRWSAFAGVFGLLSMIGVAVAGYDYLSQPGRLPLKVVDVKGEFQNLTQTAVRDAANRVIDGGFFSCDMQKLRAAILAMPWVDDVSIRRVWPDKLSMTVTEHVPLARWGDDALISVRGQVFRPEAMTGHENLVVLQGPDGSEQRVVEFFRAAVVPTRSRNLQIRAIELDQRRHWWMHFDGGLTVSLGREEYERRLAQFLRVYPNLIADPEHVPERVDMRYAHGFAVRWRDNDKATAGATAPALREKV
ncbi:MAG: cell division protein FtsQ/DivIB [Gammaproteobacteria bacterium]|nr:cell division protein FtsQ/DivIB [Gammaproteobacteria bacterium]